jgi:hypothetical protein
MPQLDRIFLGVTPGDQRRYVTGVLRFLRPRYPRLVVPAVGQFTLAKCGLAAGYAPEQIVTSDISVFSTLLGALYTGQGLAAFPFTFGEAVEVDAGVWEHPRERLAAYATDAERVAYLLWLVKLRQLKPRVYYERVVREELRRNAEGHIQRLAGRLTTLAEQYRGITYRVADLREELRQADERTVVVLNPPAYAAGSYEKMFPTNGVVDLSVAAAEFTWSKEFVAQYQASKAMAPCVIWYKRGTDLTGIAHEDVIFAKENKPGDFDFWLVNRPAEVEGMEHASAVKFRKEQELRPYKGLGTWGFDDELTPATKVQVHAVDQKHALYYRDLWAHRLGNTKADQYYLLLLDGKVFGTVGFNTSDMFRMRDRWVFEQFGFSAPSRRYLNINRLLMYLITCEDMRTVLRATISKANRLYRMDGFKTTCLAKYRHVKLNSGLLKKVGCEKLPNGLYRIQYYTEFRPQTFSEALQAYLTEWTTKQQAAAGAVAGVEA